MPKVPAHQTVGKNNIRYPVTPDVRHPDLYYAPGLYAAEQEIAELLGAITYLIKPDVAIEVGTAEGHTAYAIATAMKRTGVGELHCIEWDGTSMDRARELLVDLPVVLHEQDFTSVTFPPDTKLQFGFFDATLVEKDIEFLHFRRWFEKGAIVAFHDTGYGRQQDMTKAKRAQMRVQKLIDAGHVKTIYFKCPRGFTLGEVL